MRYYDFLSGPIMLMMVIVHCSKCEYNKTYLGLCINIIRCVYSYIRDAYCSALTYKVVDVNDCLDLLQFRLLNKSIIRSENCHERGFNKREQEVYRVEVIR